MRKVWTDPLTMGMVEPVKVVDTADFQMKDRKTSAGVATINESEKRILAGCLV